MATEIEKLLDAEKPQEPTTDLEALLDEQFDGRKDRAAMALTHAAKKNPDQQAEVNKLSQETGLPHQVVETEIDDVRAKSNTQKTDFDALFKEAPSFAERLTDPRFAGVAHDDINAIARLERELRGDPSYRDKLGLAFRKGSAMVESSEIGMRGMNDVFGIGEGQTRGDLIRLKELQHAMEFKDEGGVIAGVPIAMAEQLPIITKIITDAGAVAAGGALVGGAAGALVTKSPTGALQGAAFGAGIGFKAGGFGGAFELEGGLAFNQYIDEGMDRETAANAALIVGVVNGALEFASLRLLGKTFAGLKPLIRRKVKRAVVGETGREVAKRLGAAYLASVAGEATTEFAQELSTIIGEEVGTLISNDELDEATMGELLDNVFAPDNLAAMKESALKGGQAAVGFAGIGTAASATVQATKTKNASEQDQEQIDRIVEVANETKMQERAPETFHQLVTDIQDETDTISDVYVKAEEVQKWLVQEGIDTEETNSNPAIQNVIDQVPEAIAADGDVAVPLADFATYIAPSSSFQTIRPHLKLRPDNLTQDELSQFDSTVQERIKKLVAEAQESLELQRESEAIYERVKNQLMDTETMTRENAAASAQIIPAYVTTKAARTGLTPTEVYQRMGLSIVRGGEVTEGETFDQDGNVTDKLEFQAKKLDEAFTEREKLSDDKAAQAVKRSTIADFLKVFADTGVDIEDDAALEQDLSQRLFDLTIPRNAKFEFDPLSKTIIQREEGEVATPKKLVEQVREIQGHDMAAAAKEREISEREERLRQRIDRIFSGPTFSQERTKGTITFNNGTQTAIIRLTEASDLSTFLHESGHLFLEMEKRFFSDPTIPDEAKTDGGAILEFLGVDSFEDIKTEHHEKWAKSFEAYLYEGKAPSAELRAVFRRFAAWLKQIYVNIRTQLNVQLTPEITDVMDRMLATDEQIAEVRSTMSLEPLFQTAEEAGMTPQQFQSYKKKTQGQAEEELREKALGQLTRTAKKWWNKELFAVQQEVGEELAAEPLYRALAFLQNKQVPDGFTENKLDRAATYQMLGLPVANEPKVPIHDLNGKLIRDKLNTAIDSLSVAIAKLGGLDRAQAEAQGFDPAIWRNTKKMVIVDGRRTFKSVPNAENMPHGLFRLFKKEGGKTFDDMREILAEHGYIDQDSTESDLVEKLLEDMSGDTQYSTFANFDLLFAPEEPQGEKRRLPSQLRGLTKEGGIHPDEVAELFGFVSGDELLKQITESPSLTFATVRRANRVMVERHGDIFNDGTLQEQAREAAHNTEQGAALLAELRALSGMTNVQAITETRAIKDAAAKIIGNKRVSDLRPARYHAAEVKAAKASQTAKNAGDFEEAQAQKQRQVFNFHLWREARAAKEKADKDRARLRQMQTKKYSKVDVNPEYVGRMKQLLAAYNFKRSSSQARNNAANELDAVRQWLVAQQIDPNSPANVINVAALTEIVHYRDMSVDQMTALKDVASSILFAGRKNSAAAKQVFNDRMKEVAENIAAVGTAVDPLSPEDNIIRDTKKWSRSALAAHRKLESLVRQADGLEDLGPLWKLIVQPLLRANNKKLEMQNKAHDDLNDVFHDHEGLFNPFKNRMTFELDSGQSITLSIGGRISMALNWGNEGNRSALLDMEHTPLSENDVNQILATLTDFDWDLVQNAWDYIDTFWPQIAELEKESTGVAPRKVEPVSFETSTGRTMKGGYYPLVSDTTLGLRARQEEIDKRAERLKAGGSIRLTTQHGHTIERVGFGGRDIDLSINVLFRHIDTVIHDISHREAVGSVDRVIRNKNIRKALQGSVGIEAYLSMTSRVTEVAAGHIHPKELGAIERVLRHARLALTYGALGFSLKTGFSQMLGIGTAAGEFGLQHTARGFIDFYSNAPENNQFILERSVYMRDRIATVNRDTADILRNLKGVSALNKLRENAFFFLLSGDLAVSRPVWWAAYQQGMDRAADPEVSQFDTEQDAIDFADRAVARTQQSGLLMDLASVESKNEFVKMWTVMYSAFSAIYQIAVEQTKKQKLGKINKVQLAYNMMWILVLPALFEELMTGRGEEEDDGFIDNRWTRAVASFSLGTMAFLREVGWIMMSGRNSQLPIQKALEAPVALWQQSQQGLEEGEIDAALINSVTSALSLAHIPGASQLNRSGKYLLALEEGDEEHFDLWEFLVTGPREDE